MKIYKYTILPAITYASEAWSISMSKRAKSKLQQIQRSFLIFITKAYKTVSHEALSAIAGIMPIEQAMHLYKDIRAIARGNLTNAVINTLTLRLLISYIYGASSKARNANVVYIYGHKFGNAETVSFYLLHNVSTLNQCREVSCVTFVCKHFVS